MLLRCSSLGQVATKPRSKSEKYSSTMKTYIRSLLIHDKYGKRKSFENKFTEKGLNNEDFSIHIYNKVFNTDFKKNDQRFENGIITGEPDMFNEEMVIDIKSCWSLDTYCNKDGITDAYKWQLYGYMWLLGLKKALLAYVLTNTPQNLISYEFSREYYKGGLVELSDEDRANIASELIYSEEHYEFGFDGDIIEINDYFTDYKKQYFPTSDKQIVDMPIEKRIKIYDLEWDGEEFEFLSSKIDLAIEYMQEVATTI